jgi:hypothetical protein
LEVADIFRARERCRTAELGGHKLHCDACNTDTLAYNSCRNRHCPKCQAAAAKRWLETRQADVLPVPYFHVVFTLPEALRSIAWQNKTVVYELLFRTASQTLRTITADKRHLGANVGITAVLHTWGSSLVHHPHLHCIVTGGGLSDDRFLEALIKAHDNGRLTFFANLDHLNDAVAFAEHLSPLRQIDWVVYAKHPLAGPDAVLRYLSRYTHRIAISNRRLVAFDQRSVTFRYKDYRNKANNPWASMTLATDEFMRRFLLHVLPSGFHRIRHYGLFANAQRKHKLKIARTLLQCQPKAENEHSDPDDEDTLDNTFTCRHCGAAMIVVEILLPQAPRAPPQRQAA